MKKKLKLLSLISALAICGSMGFTACSDDGVAEHDHVYDGGTVTTQSTCYKEGVRTYRCTVEGCGQTKTAPVAMIAHSWNDGEITKQAKCNEEGVKTFTCTVEGCGKTKEEPVEKTEHGWESGEITKTPDFLTNGIKTLICRDCKTQKTESVKACADFSGQFYSALTESNNWLYGYATAFNAQTGEVDFARISQTENNVWGTEKILIGKGYVYSEDIAVIAYAFNQELPHATRADIEVSFVGEESATCLNAYLVVNGGCIELNADNAKDWSYRTEEAFDIERGDIVYLVFKNNGEGKAGGELSFKLAAPCVHVWNDGEVIKQATCAEDGVVEYGCVSCGETYTEAVTERPDHNYEGAQLISDGERGHHRNCGVCGNESGVVAHEFAGGDIITEATFWTEGEKRGVCGCGETATVKTPKLNEINHADEFTVENQYGNWEYGKIDMNDWDHMAGNPKTPSTEVNEGGDGWITGDFASIKNGWMSASNAVYIAFKATEAVTVRVEIEVTRIEGMKRLDVRTDSDDENNAKYHGDYNEHGVMKVTETYTLSAGSKLYMVFTAKGEDSGFEQADYSIKITRA